MSAISVPRVLIANRGEIAIRISRAVAELGWESVAISPKDDAHAPHLRKADRAALLPKSGASAYLDAETILNVGQELGCTLVHPGYGFLSENADFAERCAARGMTFVGPLPRVLAAFGEKSTARRIATECDVAVPRGSGILQDAAAAEAFLAEIGRPVMLKAVSGGGGRGIRIVRDAGQLASEFERCRSEALASFGDDRVYAEELVENARHVEVQVVGDTHGHIAVLGERECSLQRRQQKVVEFAPALFLSDAAREKLHEDARRIASHVGFSGLGTVEFLVPTGEADDRRYFLEVNPRLQVEHTVTEEVTGVDLVKLQLRIATGASLADEDLPDPLRPRGVAVQLRINTETMQADGTARPAAGTVRVFDLPSGPGVRVDTLGHVGYRNSLDFDALLAKLIVHVPERDYPTLIRKAYRALCETRIDGIATNLEFLRGLMVDLTVRSDRFDTGFIDRSAGELITLGRAAHPSLDSGGESATTDQHHVQHASGPEGSRAVVSPNDSRVLELFVQEGDVVRAGQAVAVTEAMKMEFVVAAEFGGTVAAIPVRKGDTLLQGAPLLFMLPDGEELGDVGAAEVADPDFIRDDLRQLIETREKRADEARPEAVARRRKTNQRTARENIADLCDPGSFREYGGLAVAAQRLRRSVEDLQKISPADGLVTGTGTINATQFGSAATRCAVLAYDYTVFAGTQGALAHLKKNRLFRLAEKQRMPVVMFAEGGGGRPGDTDDAGLLRLYNPTFWQAAKLNRLVPVIAIVSGRCFAGNAALASVADVIIATRDASIGMGGPAMIEGGGLGEVAAEDIGPVSMQAPNGVVDIVVEDEAEAVAVAKTILSCTQGTLGRWTHPDQRRLRHVVPMEARRAYRMEDVIDLLVDTGSAVKLRSSYGLGVITAIARIAGHPVAILANNPEHLGGAIDTAASTKAAEFMGLVEKYQLPLLKLCDTPGFMVGPVAEREGLVRQAGRMFAAGAQTSVPQFTVIVRKAYGLGALAMVGGNAHEQVVTVSWPTGHFGKMGLEGQVRLGHRKELDAITDPDLREARVREMVEQLRERGTALNVGAFLSVDEVIDPADTREWIIAGLESVRAAMPRHDSSDDNDANSTD